MLKEGWQISQDYLHLKLVCVYISFDTTSNRTEKMHKASDEDKRDSILAEIFSDTMVDTSGLFDLRTKLYYDTVGTEA